MSLFLRLPCDSKMKGLWLLARLASAPSEQGSSEMRG